MKRNGERKPSRRPGGGGLSSALLYLTSLMVVHCMITVKGYITHLQLIFSFHVISCGVG